MKIRGFYSFSGEILSIRTIEWKCFLVALYVSKVNQAWEWLRIYSDFRLFLFFFFFLQNRGFFCFFLVKCSNKPSSFKTCENPGKWKGSMENPWEKVLLKNPQNIRFWGKKILKNKEIFCLNPQKSFWSIESFNCVFIYYVL